MIKIINERINMLNMDKVRNKLASYDKTKKGGKKLTPEQQEKSDKIKKYIWKPEPGKQVVRIVPYQYCPDFPFIELKWHYDFNGDKVSYLSPSSFNEADPIVELANRLEKVKETWLKGRKMQPKIRTYVPIIVRGHEEEGIKFWGFGARVHEQLLAAISDPDYGDITDLNNGHDITVDFKTAEELKADFPDTKILLKPKSRPVVDTDNPKAKEIMETITKKQPNICDIYKPASYEELAAALEIKLENERRGEAAGSEPRGADRTSDDPFKGKSPAPEADADDNVVLPSEEEIAANTPATPVAEVVAEPTTPPVSPTAEKAKKVNLNMSAADFEEAFKKVTGKK
jgi:hypothetical protein